MEEMCAPRARTCDWHAVLDADRRLLFVQTHTDERLDSVITLMLDGYGLTPWLDRALVAVSEAWERDVSTRNRDLRLRVSAKHEMRVFPLRGRNTQWIGIVLHESDGPAITALS